MEGSKKPKLKSLHPEKLTDKEFAIYKDEFDFVFSDPLCRNVAVSGPYGAGKSSVIEKEKEDQSDLDWITVSLASFGKNKEESTKPNSTDSRNDSIANDAEKTNDIEAEVLRQIIYKINPATAPKSRLHKTQDQGRLKDFGLALYAVLFIISCFLLSSCITNLSNGTWSWFDIGVIAAWTIMLFLGVYQIARHDALSKFVKSFKFLNTEINIQPENQTPYERCIDELVYLLKAAKVDVVVFEDLDRFDNLPIFQKMLSLNELVNEDKGNSETEPLRFFYLIKDSLFDEPRDRTKFFDYIIPVIPYVDPNNALDVFRQALKDVGIEVDDGFLFQLASFIDDPRIVHDVVDEAHHYKQVLFETRQALENDWENLLAMLAYKAMFPRDFEYLQVGRGYLYEVINGRCRLIDDIRNWSDEEIQSLHQEITNIESRLQMSEDELLLLYALPKMMSYLYNGYNYGNITTQLVASSNSIEVMKAIQSKQNAADKLAEIQNDLEENNSEYKARLLEVRNDARSRSNAARARLKEISDMLATLQSCTIKQLVERAATADSLFIFASNQIQRPEDFEDLKMGDVLKSPSFPMLRFLVVEGWINEDYQRYLSKHHGMILSTRDDDFLASLIQAKSVDMGYKPDQSHEVLRRLGKDVFARPSARNPWLIAELLKGGNREKIDVFMESVKRVGQAAYIVELTVSEQFVPEMFDQFPAYFDNLVVNVLEADDIDTLQKRAFARKYIAYGGESFQGEKSNGAFANWINSTPLLLERDNAVDTDSLKKGLLTVSYAPVDVDLGVSDPQLIRFIYNEKLFAPDARIVDKLLNEILGNAEALSRGMLATTVLGLSEGCISEVVSADIDGFVESVVENTPTSIKDSPETILAILNNSDVKKETSRAYISKLDTDIEIPRLVDVDNKEDRIELFNAGCVASTTCNIVCYYVDCEFRANDQLGHFLSAKKLPDDLTLSTIQNLNIEVDVNDFTESLIKCDTITAECLEALLSQYGVCYETFDLTDYPEEKIAVLIDTGTILMNEEMLQAVRSHGGKLASHFAISDIEKYIDLVAVSADGTRICSFSADEMFTILDSKVDEEKRLRLLKEYAGVVSLKESYPDSLKMAIIEEYFDDADLQKLADWYDDSSTSIKERIRACFCDNLDKAIEDDVRISWNLVLDLSDAISSNREVVLKLLIWYCEKNTQAGDRPRLIELFKAYGLHEYAKLLIGPSSMIIDSELDDQLLSVLQAKQMCGTVKAEVNPEGKRQAFGTGYTSKGATTTTKAVKSSKVAESL